MLLQKFAPNVKAALARGSATAAAVKPQPATEAAAGPAAARRLSEEHAALLRQAEVDAQWARGGKKGQHISAGRPKQPGIRVRSRGRCHAVVAHLPNYACCRELCHAARVSMHLL